MQARIQNRRGGGGSDPLTSHVPTPGYHAEGILDARLRSEHVVRESAHAHSPETEVWRVGGERRTPCVVHS